MQIARQNQQMFFTVGLCLALGLAVAYFLQAGIDKKGDKQRVLALADELTACKSQAQYLALLEKHYPEWQKMAELSTPSAGEAATTRPAFLDLLPDGRLKAVVATGGPGSPLLSGLLLYIPALLLDDRGNGYRLDDVSINARETFLVFEYFYRRPPEADRRPAKAYRFFHGRDQWILQPGRPQRP